MAEKIMYKHNVKKLEFENFNLLLDGSLRSDNRWVKLAMFIPWQDVEVAYAKKLSGSEFGPPAKSVRIALGVLIIKENLGTSHEETVEQIRENLYLQFFLGFTDYRDKEPFHPKMFVHFRKRFGKKANCQIIETLSQKARASKKRAKDDDKDESGGYGSGKEHNQGKLLIDATKGYCFLDRLSCDAYNESVDLIAQSELYRDRSGSYLTTIHADKIYRTRDNIKFCRKHGIRLSRPSLGRPPYQSEERKAEQKLVRQDELDRIPIERKFGRGKRQFSLSKIMSMLNCTSEIAIAVVFLVMNLEKWLKSLVFTLIILLSMLSFIGNGSLESCSQASLNAYQFAGL